MGLSMQSGSVHLISLLLLCLKTCPSQDKDKTCTISGLSLTSSDCHLQVKLWLIDKYFDLMNYQLLSDICLKSHCNPEINLLSSNKINGTLIYLQQTSDFKASYEDNYQELKSSSMQLRKQSLHEESVILMQENAEVTSVHQSQSEARLSASCDGVSITPSYIEFKDAAEGITCRQRITIKNTGRKSAYVRIRNPKSIAFQVKSLKGGVMLNPGLSVSTLVSYTFKRPSLLRATIPIEINGKVINYRVICTLATEYISIEPKAIDFGTIDVGYSSGVKVITISNEGGKSTKFSIDLGKNDLEITVKPLRGIVRPNRVVKLKVELIGLWEGTYYGEFWIKSTPNIRVPLTVNVIVPRLVAYHPNTTGDFTLMDFPPTFENTQRYDTFILRNLSSQMASYVVLGEVGNDIQCIRDIDRKAHPVFSTFEIKPVEGRMDPFEGIIFEVKFSPTKELMQWRQKWMEQQFLEGQEETDNRENDFMAFMRIVRAIYLEREIRKDTAEESIPDNKTLIFDTAIMDITPFSSSRSSSIVAGIQDTVRLCLHGEVEPVQLNLEPNELYFDDLRIGETSQRVVCISNASSFTPVSFKHVPNAIAHCEPKFFRLKPEGSVAVLVKVKGKEHVLSSFNIYFDAIVDSKVSSPRRRKVKVTAKRYAVQCSVKVLSDRLEKPRAQFVLGLTPVITNQVGLNTNEVTFKSDIEKPRQAMLMVQSDQKRPWANKHLLSCNVVADSLPAYPNDTQCSLRRYTGPPVRSIFTGKLRWTSGPIHPEELSKQEMKNLQEHRTFWMNFMRSEFNADKKKLIHEIEDENDKNIVERVTRIPKWKFKYPSENVNCTSLPSSSKAKAPLFGSKAEVLIPLSPIQIYNVHIFPTMFTFGIVAPESNNYRQLIVENSNDFPVMIRLLNTSSKHISFPDGNMVILGAGSVVARLVEFHATDIGKFNGYIDYVINDNHTFELSITADVVGKQLSLYTRNVLLGSEFLSEELYRPLAASLQIKNKLDAKTAFKWEIPATSGFMIEPSRGIVRGNSTLSVYAYHEPSSSKTSFTEAIMKCEGGTYITVRMAMVAEKPNVIFLSDSIDFGDIPINLSSKSIAILRNFDPIEYVFEVDSTGLVRGCDINPSKGVMPPCGIVRMEITLKLDACVRFSITIRVIIQRRLQVSLKISGNVPFPRLKLSPKSINLRRISAAAYNCQEIIAKNIGTTRLKLNFIFNDYAEFWVSLLPTRRDTPIGEEGIVLAPATITKFYLHFEPVDLASYAFHLPIIINDMFGPALADFPKSLYFSEYTKPNEEYYAGFPGFQVEELRVAKLPSTFIDCTVAKHIICFSNLLFSFDDSTKEHDLKIENKDTPSTVNILIRTDEFLNEESPFSIEWTGGVQAKISGSSITCSLEPKTYVIFSLKSEPVSEGDFMIEAPIFIPGECGDKMFNKLCLYAKNPPTSLECNPTELYLSPIALSSSIEETFKLRAKHFRKKATISARITKYDRVSGEYRSSMIVIDFPHGCEVEPGPFKEVDVRLIFKSVESVSVCLNIEFRIESKALKCQMKIYLTSDNNLLTTYVQSTKSIDNIRRAWACESFISKLSQSTIPDGAEDEEYDEPIGSNPSQRIRPRRGSQARVSFHAYFGTPKRGSILKASESKFKFYETKHNVENDSKDGHRDSEQLDMNLEFHQEQRDSFHSAESLLKLYKASSRQLMYPMDVQNDEYEIHMKRTMAAAEKWLYSGPYKFKFYPTILDGISTFFCNQYESRKVLSSAVKQKHHTFNWSFINAIASLAGEEFNSIIGYTKEKIPQNKVERTQYMVSVCDKMLLFLLSRGACVSHVPAQLLLSYDDYLITKESNQISSTDVQLAAIEKMSRQAFECRSKQCWLDVILQTYKCFVLKRVSGLKFDRISTVQGLLMPRKSMLLRDSISVASNLSSRSSIPRDYEVHERSMRDVMDLTNNRRKLLANNSNEEAILLSWLQYNYDQQCQQEWMRDKRLILNPHETKEAARRRLILNFDIDLLDSLVLITATAAYCPFLIEEYFSNLYICPRSYEETLHNAICIVDAWKRIRIGFMITPTEIVCPNCIQMLMLVEHLFETLPTYLARAKIKFCCPLTETVNRQISFTNPTSFGVSYLVLFIGNDAGFFTILNPQPTLRLNGHDGAQLKIKYHARKIRKIRAYLLLCGSAIGPNFGRNHTFILEGRVDNLRITNEYVIRTKLYQVVEKTLKISVPYEYATEYEIWMTDEQPTKPNTLKMAKWSDLIARKIPRRLFLNQRSVVVTEGAQETELTATVACIAPSCRSFWLIFQSKLGDFIIQINSEWAPSITDRIVIEWCANDKECTCTSARADDTRSDCPRNIIIPIPSRNTQLWNCVSKMFEKTLDPQERLFWARYFDTYIGLRLIHWLMGDTTDTAAMEFAHIFNTKVTYNVSTSDKSSQVVLPETVTIEDVRPLNKTVTINVHLPEISSGLYEMSLSLNSMSNRERRLYVVSVLCI